MNTITQDTITDPREFAAGKTRAEIEQAARELGEASRKNWARDGVDFMGMRTRSERLEQIADEMLQRESAWLHTYMHEVFVPLGAAPEQCTVTIPDARKLLSAHRLEVLDTSGGRSFGYGYAVFVQGGAPSTARKPILEAQTVTTTRPVGGTGFGHLFSEADLHTLIILMGVAVEKMPTFRFEVAT